MGFRPEPNSAQTRWGHVAPLLVPDDRRFWNGIGSSQALSGLMSKISHVWRHWLQVTTETAVLCSASSMAAPKEAAKFLVDPLLASLEAELPSLKRAGADASDLNISKVASWS